MSQPQIAQVMLIDPEPEAFEQGVKALAAELRLPEDGIRYFLVAIQADEEDYLRATLTG
jgi:hypothetical protein